jgi:hypothetical protein
MIRQLHHTCVLTGDLNRLTARLGTILALPEAPSPRFVSTDDMEIRTVMLPVGNGTYLQILEPHRGPGVAELAAGGEGALYEVAFEVERAQEASVAVRAQGITPQDLVGRPLADGFATAASGSRFLYLPREATGGVRVELIQPAG